LQKSLPSKELDQVWKANEIPQLRRKLQVQLSQIGQFREQGSGGKQSGVENNGGDSDSQLVEIGMSWMNSSPTQP
jgi:hypothetical protein